MIIETLISAAVVSALFLLAVLASAVYEHVKGIK